MVETSLIETYLHDLIGLDSASIGPETVARAVRHRMRESGVHAAQQYLAFVSSSPAELQLLIDAVSVPETWFFRDDNVFAYLQRFVRLEWLPKSTGRKLRILSVPCSSGEEPYTIAMSLADAAVLPYATIDAVDIRPSAIAIALRGLYRSNSFRGADLAYRDRHFQKTGQGYQLAPSIMERVQFTSGNILDPNFMAGAEPFDIIFCRNLLIYFDDEKRHAALKTVNRCLAPNGIVFVGHAEALWAAQGAFELLPQANVFGLRRRSASAAQPRAMAAKTAAVKPAHRRKSGVYKLSAIKKPAPAPEEPKPIDRIVPMESKNRALLTKAQTLADSGQLFEAAELIEQFLRDEGPNADSYFLLAMIHQASGDLCSSQVYLNKTLYLNPDHEEALTCLALQKEQKGDKAGARIVRQRASRLRERRDHGKH